MKAIQNCAKLMKIQFMDKNMNFAPVCYLLAVCVTCHAVSITWHERIFPPQQNIWRAFFTCNSWWWCKLLATDNNPSLLIIEFFPFLQNLNNDYRKRSVDDSNLYEGEYRFGKRGNTVVLDENDMNPGERYL